MLKVGVVGGTGYTGAELLRLLVQHPEVEIACVTSRSEQGVEISALFPNLRGHLKQQFCAPDISQLKKCDLVFFATPNGTAMNMVPDLLGSGARVVDLAADFRIRDAAVWQKSYSMEHSCPDLLAQAVYGLPEVYRASIKEAQLVANPGCYPTAVTLGFLPLLEKGLLSGDALVADVKSGVSGAGRKASVGMLMGECGESFKAYSVPAHRHHPEITQTLCDVANDAIKLTFVPHLVPMVRGIHATLYGRAEHVDLQGLFEARYEKEPFVDVLLVGGHPETRSVRGANSCQIAVHRPQDSDHVVILSVIDNLVKGAAGQAVQNMNIMFGFDETLGLTAIATLP